MTSYMFVPPARPAEQPRKLRAFVAHVLVTRFERHETPLDRMSGATFSVIVDGAPITTDALAVLIDAVHSGEPALLTLTLPPPPPYVSPVRAIRPSEIAAAKRRAAAAKRKAAKRRRVKR